MAKTGLGATITFGTSGFAMNVRSIGGTEQTREKIDTTYLGSSDFYTYIPDDLVQPGEFTIEYIWDGSSGQTYPPISAAAETITITLRDGDTLSGTGFWVRSKGPDLNIGALNMGEGTIAWDGVTGPTYST